MTNQPDREYLLSLVREFRNLPQETDWLEFKVNQADPVAIGEYVSALSNAAALCGKSHAYMLWGIEDGTHDVVGTTFSPPTSGKGNEPLETWLLRLLEPRIDFAFHEVVTEGRKIVLLEIDRAFHRPVSFRGVEFVRIGSAKKKLKEQPEKERALWRLFDRISFEQEVALERVSAPDVLKLLDYPKYFDLLRVPPADGTDAIAEALARDRLIARSVSGGFDISNLGAMLFARDLGDFPRLRRKALRVIFYRGKDRLDALSEQEFVDGYASGFNKFIDYMTPRLPAYEEIVGALRRSRPSFPELAVRELLANALIHQDFAITGAGPMVEVFNGRLEVSNPGEPLVNTQRFLDTPPVSRNEAVASLMRRFRICEERGSGIDKVVEQIELHQLPPPRFDVPPGFTRVLLFDRKTLGQMDKQERLRACYLHACLQFVTGRRMTNSSLRERLGVLGKNASMVSRILREAVDAGLIVVANPENGVRMRHYVPFWAVSGD